MKILTYAKTKGTWIINFLRTKTQVKSVLSHFFPLWFLGFFLCYLEVFLSLMIIFYYLIFPMAFIVLPFTIRCLLHLGFNCEIPMKLYYFYILFKE